MAFAKPLSLKLCLVAATLILALKVADSYQPTFMCKYGEGKCPGDMHFHTGFMDSGSHVISSFNHSYSDNCSVTCQLRDGCWYSTLLTVPPSTCTLYSKNSSFTKSTAILKIYQWQCCKEEDVCVTQKDHCRGFWVVRPKAALEGLRVLANISNDHAGADCRLRCIEHPLCAYVNVWPDRCELLRYNASAPLRWRLGAGVESKVNWWYCCSHDDSDLPQSCEQHPGKCKGYWNVTTPPPTRYENRVIGSFFSMSKTRCMSECVVDPFCTHVTFNQSAALCLMMSERPWDSRFHTCDHRLISPYGSGYRWTCCDPSQPVLQPQKLDPPIDAECVCPNGTVALAADGCSQPMKPKVLASSPSKAFWLKDSLEVTWAGQAWTRIFNGEFFLWISESMASLPRCPTSNCETYSTVLGPPQCPQVLNRSQWFALPFSKKPTPLTPPPKMVVILNSKCPMEGCYTNFSCSDDCREIQRYQIQTDFLDIAYNQLVGEDGRIYDGVGPTLVGAHTLGHNTYSLGIAFIGDYENRTPNVASLLAVRRQLHCLVARCLLRPDYQLYAHTDLRRSNIPGKALRDLLPNWGNYFASQLPRGLDCEALERQKVLRLIIYCGGSGGGALLLLVGVVLYVAVYRHQTWCPRRRGKDARGRPDHAQASCVVCSVRPADVVEQRLGACPSSCVVRQAATLQVHPFAAPLLLVTSKGDLECRCSTFFVLLWAHCFSRSLCEFPSLLKNSLTWSNRCGAAAALLWTDALYLLHLPDADEVMRAMKVISDGACACQDSGFTVRPVEVPNMDGQESFASENVMFDASRILDQRLHRFESLNSYCRMFVWHGNGRVEVTYQGFQRDVVVAVEEGRAEMMVEEAQEMEEMEEEDVDYDDCAPLFERPAVAVVE